MADSGQKNIGRNRAPRVQIEYDVEQYGAEKKVELPFVMGVLSDLSGNAGENSTPVDQREFAEVDVDNIDDYMESTAPKVSMRVQNVLTEEGGEMDVGVSFAKMDDFSPAAVARQVEPLRQLIEAREQLSNLRTLMDGRAGAEDLIAKLLQDPALMKSLSQSLPSDDQQPEEES